MLRRIAERLARNRTFRRRLPAAFGRRPVYVSADAALSYLKRHPFPRDLLRLSTDYVEAGDRVWDIGANVGAFAFAAAHQAGTDGAVIAVDPDPWLAALMQRTVEHPRNGDLAVRVLCAAVADEPGYRELHIAGRGRASNFLADAAARSQRGGTRGRLLASVTTLDQLYAYAGAPRLVKIDVEGSELAALRGGHELFRSARPAIYIEVGAHHAESVTKLFHEHNYSLFTWSDKGDRPRRIETCAFNTLAFPKEREPETT